MLHLKDVKPSRSPLPPFDHITLPPPHFVCYSSKLRRPCFSQIPLLLSSFSVGIPPGCLPPQTHFIPAQTPGLEAPAWKRALSHTLPSEPPTSHPSKKIINCEPLEEYVVFLLCTLLNNA